MEERVSQGCNMTIIHLEMVAKVEIQKMWFGNLPLGFH